VLLRYFFHSAIFWAEETLRYLIVWVSFIGAATCVREASHISLDTLVKVLPPRIRRVAAAISGIILVLAFIELSWLSVDFVLKIRNTGQTSATLGNIPMFAVYLCIPLGFIMAAWWALIDLVRTLRRGAKEA
jgi:C4-dicarboxylate transporter DctQ subunit